MRRFPALSLALSMLCTTCAPADLRSQDARERSKRLIEFESSFRIAGAGSGGSVVAEVKFGLCRDGDPLCEIIERAIELALPGP